MPDAVYEQRSDSVLAWKKTQKLGRFDPAAPEHARQKIAATEAEVTSRGIDVGKRCQLGDDSSRRGVVRYVGEIPEVPGPPGPWVGVELDEPVGKNDGHIGGKRYFECREAHGVFVRPERVLIGDYGVLLEEEDMEEI
jgi:tubulin-specific chaperone B